jgi:hypothetical protein
VLDDVPYARDWLALLYLEAGYKGTSRAVKKASPEALKEHARKVLEAK